MPTREAVDAALRFAERRRMGPFASAAADRAQREKWIAAMIRAGHGFGLARAIPQCRPAPKLIRINLANVCAV